MLRPYWNRVGRTLLIYMALNPMVSFLRGPEFFKNCSRYWWFQTKQLTRLWDFMKLYKQTHQRIFIVLLFYFIKTVLWVLERVHGVGGTSIHKTVWMNFRPSTMGQPGVYTAWMTDGKWRTKKAGKKGKKSKGQTTGLACQQNPPGESPTLGRQGG